MNCHIWSNEHRAWWKPARCGYTTDRAEAGVYSKHEADAICGDANRYLPEGSPPNEIAVPILDGANGPDTLMRELTDARSKVAELENRLDAERAAATSIAVALLPHVSGEVEGNVEAAKQVANLLTLAKAQAADSHAQLEQIAALFCHDDTIGGEPYGDYVTRQVTKLRQDHADKIGQLAETLDVIRADARRATEQADLLLRLRDEANALAQARTESADRYADQLAKATAERDELLSVCATIRNIVGIEPGQQVDLAAAVQRMKERLASLLRDGGEIGAVERVAEEQVAKANAYAEKWRGEYDVKVEQFLRLKEERDELLIQRSELINQRDQLNAKIAHAGLTFASWLGLIARFKDALRGIEYDADGIAVSYITQARRDELLALDPYKETASPQPEPLIRDGQGSAFCGAGDPRGSQDAQDAVVAREGLGVIRPGSHRHRVLAGFLAHPEGLRQLDAGQIALDQYSVGKNTEAGANTGRRRCTDLAAMGMIQPLADHDRSAKWGITTDGIEAMKILDRGEPVRVPAGRKAGGA